MYPERATHAGSSGVTRVRGCCTFAWVEANGRRVVLVPDGAHDACLAELERVAVAQGVYLSLVRQGSP